MKEFLKKVETFAVKNVWWIIVIMTLLEVIVVKDLCNRQIINYQQTVIEQKDKEMRTMDNYRIEIDTVSGIGTVTKFNH